MERLSNNKKAKFVKSNEEQLLLNQEIITKSSKLFGLKGYYTDMEVTSLSYYQVIKLYHELYKIEQAFRIAKSDLENRPIFHFKEEPIKLHLLICFIASVISKHVEIITGLSIRRIINEWKKIIDARMLDTITQKEIIIKGRVTEKAEAFLSKLNLSH